MNIGTASYLVAFIAFAALTTLMMIAWRGHQVGSRMIAASLLSAAWAGISAASLVRGMPMWLLVGAEYARDISWGLFLLHLLQPQNETDAPRWLPPLAWSLFLGAGLVIFGAPFLTQWLELPIHQVTSLRITAWLGLAVLALLLVEQLYRNASEAQRWTLKYLCIGLGGIFAYDLYLFTDALLFRRMDEHLWMARGAVNGLLAPLIAVSVARNPDWSMRIHVSRQVVFHSFTLMGVGLFLLGMAGVGYLLRLYGGDWGAVAQTVFLSGMLILLAVLLFSAQVRAKFRVLLSKHFFNYKYDYRTEWLRFTRTLAQGDEAVPMRIIRAIAALVQSPGGILWARTDKGQCALVADWNMPHVEVPDDPPTAALTHYLEQRQWIIDLPEYARDPDHYDGLVLPDWLRQVPGAWLLVPLASGDRLIGMLLLKQSDVVTHINWEDRDLLKVAAQQAASHLAQHMADHALMQARQFEAFNRLSAYVVHDLKNILAQQSLIVANAERHKHNPAFVDDVIDTVRNSVARMTRLMEQMRSGMRGNRRQRVKLDALLHDVVERRAGFRPAPSLELPETPVFVEGDPEQLATVFGHLVQNAQEATPDDGRVTVRLRREGDHALIEVEDTGSGMDEDFVQHRLFRPFDSTKGLTGMGIGAFESREIIQSLGGNIAVTSMPGKGTHFRITIPALQPDDGEPLAPTPEGTQSSA